ncbi:hypothetical protein TD95_000771 [Thielaviopsis punctulata]|uniref:3',5'-cyclic-nucleotide phosphodiesterase n=1 Tax=Thielaviopsis punctulata TaxID=72032 RepID=A0A0F4Z9J5_9PEZI|nr:hypothetical protein TD95_000771 [Thielaviopsis punctulata]
MVAAHEKPAMQVIVLGSGGGPLENNTTAFLVRSIASGWAKGSVVAVDAGVHLSAISRILEETQPRLLGYSDGPKLPHTLDSGPFAGLELHSRSAIANGAHITRNLIDTYLITHPHLDHISGFVVNTAALPGTRPKRLAGLPTTISAFKNHIFNNVIWPNLSDENNGAGLVTYMRLVEGGSPALGDGDNRGYVEISDGLSVKMWSVSHGHCMERHSHRGSTSSQGGYRNSIDTTRGSLLNPNASSHRKSSTPNHCSALSRPSHSHSLLTQAVSLAQAGDNCRERICVYDSSAYFIRDISTAREVLIFGDVEPDSISLSPRNYQVWIEAGPKVAQGHLAAIFIECSYDNSQADDRLYGHLKPVYIIEELQVLAEQVRLARREAEATRESSKKRKRENTLSEEAGRPRRPVVPTFEDPVSPKSLRPVAVPAIATPEGSNTPRISSPLVHAENLSDLENLPESLLLLPPTPTPHRHEPMSPPQKEKHKEKDDEYVLRGVKVVIIHMKEKITDEPEVGLTIKKELDELETVAKLGCEFIISYSGQSLYV